jgi:acetyl esterase/lipase
MFAEWAAQWSLDYALLHSAILISPNYRLLPESNGLDVLSDITDLWTWVEHSFPEYLKTIGSDVAPDFSKVLTSGESAGGYLAIQSGLMRRDFVRAVVATYPMTYVDSPWYAVASTTKRPFGAPQVPRSVLDEHLSRMEKGRVVSGAFPMERMEIALVLLQQGLWTGRFGEDDSLFPARTLEKMQKGEKVPFLLAMHGKDDTAVPHEETERFVREWKAKFGEERALGVFEPGEHGFDGEATLETEWLKDGLKEVTREWLG